MKAIEWTEAHRREALRRTYELAAQQASASDKAYSSQTIRVDVGTEDEWRSCLTWVVRGIDPARIDSEVRRVDGLATGRLVRETVWRVCWPGGGTRIADSAMVARMWAMERADNGRVVRVTRIRKAVAR